MTRLDHKSVLRLLCPRCLREYCRCRLEPDEVELAEREARNRAASIEETMRRLRK